MVNSQMYFYKYETSLLIKQFYDEVWPLHVSGDKVFDVGGLSRSSVE
jgi:hypothetical protein